MKAISSHDQTTVTDPSKFKQILTFYFDFDNLESFLDFRESCDQLRIGFNDTSG